ncbi:MAG: GNAT family N-acetyltransferase [Desulfarculaceae bacterium]|nr:GNAT family N-acetyltransferase [Desulfarculaceae bacterium]MCF8073842.1 GNAT family N-acetyltransferase [Desulfarculaceae bacterium]MCF8102822.1 GNAT family N-acetyltransferase [Desulfarculaceae bacterium]MCF8116266.1 GNAT family N-acetyltransferase [Desulfarculaceae bacterium]
MEIKKITDGKKRFMDLLLLADEQESMIHKYLERGEMFALYDGDLKSICVVTQEGEDVFELKSLATYEKYQGQGHGSRLVKFICQHYKDRCRTMLVGTGAGTPVVGFYEHLGFTVSHIVKNFFLDHYDHRMYENGIQLVDMVYLKKDLEPKRDRPVFWGI